MALALVTAFGLVVALVGFNLLDRLRRTVGDHYKPNSSPPISRGAGFSRSSANSAGLSSVNVVSRATNVRNHAWKWTVPAILLAVVAAEGNSLASIGWRIESLTAFAGRVAAGLLLLAGANLFTAPLWMRVGDGGESLAAGLGAFASLSVPERLFVAVTAGATEEMAFHGYALERLLALTGSVPVAGGISFLAFTLAHLGDTWDRHAVLRIAQPALVTTLLYLWFRSLPVLIAIHALNDGVGLLLAERFETQVERGPGDANHEPEPKPDRGTDSAAIDWLRGE